MSTTIQEAPVVKAVPEAVPIGIARTVLAPTLEGLLWDEAFNLGSGFDAVTGLPAAEAALQPFLTPETTEMQPTERYGFIQSFSELDQEIERAVPGRYNLRPLAAGPATDYLSDIAFSEFEMTLVAHQESLAAGYDRPEIYELTPAARSLAADPDRFRARYGDYFLAGCRRGARFTAVYRCQAASGIALEKLRTAFGGEPPRVLTREGTAAFVKAAHLYGVEISVSLFLLGCQPRGGMVQFQTTPDGVLSELGWFKSHERAVPLQAELRHFSALVPELPRQTPVDPEDFAGLARLCTALWRTRSRFGSCPDPYRRQLEEHFVRLEAGILSERRSLAADVAKRRLLEEEANRMLAEVQEVFDRRDFFTRVQAAVREEPVLNEPLEDAPGGPDTWAFGFDEYPQSKAVVLCRTDLRFAKAWHLGGWREHTFTFGPDSKHLIVGWKVISNRTDDHNGSWMKLSHPILLSHEARVHVKSQYDRGCDWCLTLFYVNAADYQF